MKNPFVATSNENRWILPVSVLSLVVGLMTAMAIVGQANRSNRVTLLDNDARTRLSLGTLDLSADNEKLRSEIKVLRENNTRLEEAVASNSDSAAELNESLKATKAAAGLTEVEGPGVTVTLRDSTQAPSEALDVSGQIIHDTDVLRVINELRNAGAEAISVNNRRVGLGTNVRCVGTTILVDESRIASPVVIRAIGEADTLFGGINLPGGILSELKAVDPNMAEVAIVRKMRLPAFSGVTTFKVAKTVPPEPAAE